MNHIRKAVLFLIMLFLIVPSSIVNAQEDEPVTDQVLSIIVKKNKTKNIVKEFISSDISLPDKTSIPGLIISYDEVSNSFIINVKGTVDLKGYLLDSDLDPSLKSSSLIFSTCNLKIIGNGTLNMTVISNMSDTHNDYSDLYWDYYYINAYDINESKAKDVLIGNDEKGPKINMNVSMDKKDDKFYNAINGIKANSFSFKNSTVNYNGIGYVFTVSRDNDLGYTNRLYSYNSHINIKFKELKGCCPFVAIVLLEDPDVDGDYIFESSELNVNNKYDDYTEVIDPCLMVVPKRDISFSNSKIKFNDPVFCFTLASCNKMIIENSDLDVDTTKTPSSNQHLYFISSKDIQITDTNFDIKTTRPVFVLPEQSSIAITENSDDYKGKISIISNTQFSPFTLNPSYDALLLSKVTITTKGKNVIKTSKVSKGKHGFSLSPNADVTVLDDVHTFIYDYPDTIPDIEWNYFEIASPYEKKSPKHVVLNTCVN